jgi:hypothetical protein
MSIYLRITAKCCDSGGKFKKNEKKSGGDYDTHIGKRKARRLASTASTHGSTNPGWSDQAGIIRIKTAPYFDYH